MWRICNSHISKVSKLKDLQSNLEEIEIIIAEESHSFSWVRIRLYDFASCFGLSGWSNFCSVIVAHCKRTDPSEKQLCYQKDTSFHKSWRWAYVSQNKPEISNYVVKHWAVLEISGHYESTFFIMRPQKLKLEVTISKINLDREIEMWNDWMESIVLEDCLACQTINTTKIEQRQESHL